MDLQSTKRFTLDSKEVGLAVGLLLGEELVGMKDLHYGYWTEGMAPTLQNLPKAQAQYSDFLAASIPDGTKTILDVGSGTGNFAQKLIAKGFAVDCVSPNSFLTDRVQDLLGDRAEIYRTRFEDLEAQKKYDLVLFSESFQYVDPELVLSKAKGLLNPNGAILICDFFKKETAIEGPLGGGHSYEKFLEQVSKSAFQISKDEDITDSTAPTLDVVNNLLHSVAAPLKDMICGFVNQRHPTISKFLSWKLRPKFEKINRKYFSGELNGKNFKEFKTYHLFLLTAKGVV